MAFFFIILHLIVYPIFYIGFCDNPNFGKYGEMFKNAYLRPEQKCKLIDANGVYLDMHWTNWNIFVYFMSIPLPYLGFLLKMKYLKKYMSNKVNISYPSNIWSMVILHLSIGFEVDFKSNFVHVRLALRKLPLQEVWNWNGIQTTRGEFTLS